MNPGKNPKSLLGILACFFLFSSLTNGQTFSFRHYGTDNKLPDSYVYSLVQDVNGFLWIGTGKGPVKFDGFEFYNVPFTDSLSNRYASVIKKDSKGRLWLGCNDGSLFYTLNNDLIKTEDKGIQSISDIIEENGYIYIICQDKQILKINIDNPENISVFNVPWNISMTTACFLSTGELLLGTQENLLLCDLTKDSLSVRNKIEGIDYSRIQVLKSIKDKEIFIVGTESSGLYKLSLVSGKPVLSRFRNHPELQEIKARSVLIDKESNLWIATYGSGALQYRLTDEGGISEILNTYNTSSGLTGNDINCVFQDMEGNIWLGFYGEGLSMLNSVALTYYSPSENPELNNIIYISGDKSPVFLGTPTGYYNFNLKNGKPEAFINLFQQVGRAEITSYFQEKNSNLWIGTKGNGLYLKLPGGQPKSFYRTGNTGGEDHIRGISCDSKHVWLATLNGVLVLDKNTGAVVKKYQTGDRLPHNSINQIFLKKDGTALVATEIDRLYSIDINKGLSVDNKLMNGGLKSKVLCFAETTGGDVWAGTYRNGAFWFSKDSVANFTTADGLFSNYCYSILADSKGKIWMGHERGFSRYDTETGTVKVFSTDFAKGGDCNPNAIFENSDGLVMIGTTEGLIVYDREKDKKASVAPINNIISVTINKDKYPYRQSYSRPYGKYSVTINYVGISLTDPGKVYYSTILENFDDEWSEMKTDRESSYQLRDGRYRFKFVSVNEEGLSQDQPVTFELFIKKPFWRTWWFILSTIIISAGTIIVIIREREKAQEKIKEYLETELAARTRLVLKQKDEIELQNIEITDSINYAKRIQSSILPDINKLKETFKDAFIIFHPRDIVSGDFYWFDKISDEKFIIVCADSTGHGVPGAFMSMIGSTLLHDIISRKGITRPSEILTLLDTQIFATLNQNVDVGVSNDGMDMVVCEFDIPTRHIRFASAMRPVIIVMGGEPYYIKGNRCSVGGESVITKYFDDQEYYLAEGDTIYMFSDGLPDQFGGEDGKKMKIARMKRLLDEVSRLPMNEQKEIISNFFFDWKGDYEQVDDILLMGIRV